MGSIQASTGLISGINTQDTVDKLMQVASRPRDLLTSRIKGLQSQQAALNDLLATTIGVQLSTDRLGSVEAFNSISATSSAKDVLSVTAGTTASPGSYTANAVQTAQASSLTSGVFTSASQTLSAGSLLVRTGGFVDTAAKLDDLRGGEGVSRGFINITDRTGATKEIDLRFAVTTEDVIKKINTTDGLKVTASLDGDQIVLKDFSGQTTSNLIVTEVGSGTTASDLGFSGVNVAANTATGTDLSYLGNNTLLPSVLDGRGLRFGSGDDLTIHLRDGSSVSVDVNSTTAGEPASIGQVLARINAAGTNKFQARISSTGDSLELVDLTTGSNNFSVTSPNGKLAEDLGWNQSVSSGTIGGSRLLSGLSGPLLSSLKGGVGLGTLGSINITNRNGTTTAVDLSSAKTLKDILGRINSANAGVVATYNSNKTGIVLQDTTGGTAANFKIANGDSTNTASHLQIEADVAKTSIDSGSLSLQFVHENTLLSNWNQGRGVNLGSFTITDTDGKSKTLNLSVVKPKTIGDVLKAINTAGIGVSASINKNGDGIQIIDTAGGAGELSVADTGTGKGAADLGIAGKGKIVSIDSVDKTAIQSSQNVTISIEEGKKLSEIVTSINGSSGPVKASLLTTSGNGVRLILNSSSTGLIGRVAIESDSTDLSFTNTAQARDAILAVGSSDENGGTIISSATNTFSNAVTGLQLTINSVSTQPVTVTVSSSSSSVQKNVQAFVDQVNKVFDKIKTIASYDPATKSAGILFGSGETLRLQSTLSRFINSSTSGSTGIRSLNQLGVKFDKDGKLTFDTATFQKQLTDNQQAVQTFFTTEKTGFSARAKTVIDTLSGVDNSVLVSKTQALQNQIDSTNKRVDLLNTRLDTQRNRLLLQFQNMEKALAKLQQSQKSISGISAITA